VLLNVDQYHQMEHVTQDGLHFTYFKCYHALKSDIPLCLLIKSLSQLLVAVSNLVQSRKYSRDISVTKPSTDSGVGQPSTGCNVPSKVV